MKTIIAGSRDIEDFTHLIEAINRIDWEITEVVSGTAEGVDKMGEQFAEANDIPIKRFPPKYDEYENEKLAPIKRNQEMAEYADAAIIICKGRSEGSMDMIGKANKHCEEIQVAELPGENQETLEGVAEEAEWCK